MKFKFEKLHVWNRAMEFGEEMKRLASNFPKYEDFNLTSQLRRACDSIALNIAEGSIGQSNAEQRKFIGYSVRSLAEVVTCLHKAKKRDYVNEKEFELNYNTSHELLKMLISFKINIK